MKRYSSSCFVLFVLVAFLLNGCKASNDGQARVNDSLPQPMRATLDSTEHLLYYIPQKYDIDLVSGVRPDTLDTQVLFCAEAAFTGVIVDSFYHRNIAGNHVCCGQFNEGYVCKANKGGFIFYRDGHWQFWNKEDYNAHLTDVGVQCAYEQALVVFADTIFHPYLMKPTRCETWRVLGEDQQGRLMVVTSRDEIPYDTFVHSLIDELHLRNALYMDMGTGWNYSWYRNADSTVTNFFPIAKWTQYQTNWLIFKDIGVR